VWPLRANSGRNALEVVTHVLAQPQAPSLNTIGNT